MLQQTLSVPKSLAEFTRKEYAASVRQQSCQQLRSRARRCERTEIVFPGDMCLGKNTSHGASVEWSAKGGQNWGPHANVSEAVCVGRGGARERAQFLPLGRNGGKRTLFRRRRRAQRNPCSKKWPQPLFRQSFISSYITALMVCIRFSASSKTRDAGDSKTWSVTSMASRPNRSPISRPTWVLWSW